jgi:hypothetical protein
MYLDHSKSHSHIVNHVFEILLNKLLGRVAASLPKPEVSAYLRGSYHARHHWRRRKRF